MSSWRRGGRSWTPSSSSASPTPCSSGESPDGNSSLLNALCLGWDFPVKGGCPCFGSHWLFSWCLGLAAVLVWVRFLLRLSLPLRDQPRAEPVADRNQHPGEPAQPLGLTAEVFMLQLLGAVTSPLCKPLQKCLGTAEHSVQGQAWLCRHRHLLLLHHHPVSLGASPCPPVKQPFSTHQKAAALVFSKHLKKPLVQK